MKVRRVAGWVALAATISGAVYDPHAYAAEPKRALALLAGCALSAMMLQRKRPGRGTQLPRSIALSAAALFVLVSCVSLAWGRAPGALDLATWLGGAGFAVFAARAQRVSAVAMARLAGLWLGATVSVVAIVSAVAGARGFLLHAGQGNPNWLGLLLAATLPLALDTCILHVQRGHARTRRFAMSLAFTAPQAVALYLAHSRVAWGAAAVSILFVLAARVRARRRALLTGAAVAVIAALALRGGVAGAVERDAMTNDVPASQSLHGRVWIWKSSAVAAKDALPFGVGLGGFGHAFHDAQGRELSRMTPSAAARTYENATTAHQEYLQIAAESGLLAVLAFACALGFGAIAHARRGFHGGAGALLACAITSLGDSPFRQPAVVIVCALSLGACRALHRARRKSAGPRLGTLRTALVLGLLVASGWALLGSVRSWLSTRMYLASFSLAPDARARMLDRSARLSPRSGEPRFEKGLLLLQAGEPAAALEALDAAEERIADPGILAAKGEAYLALGDTVACERAYRSALTWNPGSLRARVGLAEALRQEGRLDDAEAEATLAKKLSPGAAQVRELIDSIREARSDE